VGNRQYDRTYSLTVIPPDGEARLITGLRVGFTITKSTKSSPNIGVFRIYNPNTDTLAAFQTVGTEIVFNAGYRGLERLLYKGQLRNVTQTREGPDRIIVAYFGDGQQDWEVSTFNKTYEGSVSIKQILTDLVGTFKGLSLETIQDVPDIADKLLGQSLSGNTRDLLDTYAEEYNFSWSIQDGAVQIIPNEEPIANDEAVVITAATGMIGSPEITEIGVDVKILLNPAVAPNRLITIESAGVGVTLGNLFFREGLPRSTANGTYKVLEVTHRGDTHGNDWFSEITGRSLDFG